ncbi:MAG: thrombospondin type 3 repeat-containing protein [Polyangiaceae bacterium]
MQSATSGSGRHGMKGAARTLGRLLALGGVVLGCTELNIAQTDVHDGPGVVQPGVVFIDPTVPGGQRGDVIIDNETIAPLRTALVNLFDSQTDAGHAVMTMNATANFAGLPGCAGPSSSGAPCCSTGPLSMCLQPKRFAGGVPSVSLFHESTFINFDPTRVSVIPGISGFSWSQVQGGQLGVELAPASGAPDPWFMLRRILVGDNRELLVRFHPDELSIETRNGQTGLWLPVTLTPVGDTAARNECKLVDAMGNAEGTFGSTLCKELIDRMNVGMKERIPVSLLNFIGYEPSEIRCNGFIVNTRFSVLRFFIGLIPETKPGCGTALKSALQFRPDLKWMKNVPGGESYPNGCLNVRAVVEPGITVNVPGGVGDLIISADRGLYCSGGVEALCAATAQTFVQELFGIGDCSAEANRSAATNVYKEINSRVRTVMEQQLLPYFNYPGTLFQAPGAGEGCNPTSSLCASYIKNHGLPASLTALAYGLFAKSVGSYAPNPEYHYPVTSAEGTAWCPPGYEHFLGADASQADVCVRCNDPLFGNPGSCTYSIVTQECCRGALGCVGPGDCETLRMPAGRVRLSFAIDQDADGIPSSADNCPDVANASQKDQDGDGVGDACELCDCDGSDDPDPDGDGVCNVECNDAPGDNCPTIPNKTQDNCNADAERARGAEILGDACDPVPCPRFEPKFLTSVSGSLFAADRRVSVALHHLEFDPRGSFDRAASQPTERAVNVGETRYRFCMHDPSANAFCFEDAAVLEDFLSPFGSRETENTSSLWHRVAFTLKLGSLTYDVVDVNDTNRTYGVGHTYNRVWNYLADYDYWRSTPWGTWVPNLTAAEGAINFKARGRFWTHSNTAIGMSDASLGVHYLKGAPPTEPASGLSNHYEELNPVQEARQLFGIRGSIFPWIVRDCPHCGPALGLPARECDACGLESVLELPSPVSRVIAIHPSGGVGVLTTAGTLSELATPLSTDLTNSLSAGLTWLSQAEPSVYIGSSASAPLAVGITSDGTSIAEQVFVADGRLLSQRDLISLGGIDDGVTSSAATFNVLPQRFESVGVYSRSQGRVFLLGGKDSAGSPMAEIWSRVLGEPTWQVLPPPADLTLGEVLTATYSHGDGLLWIVDEKPGKHFLVQRRLLTYDPRTAETRVLLERLGLPQWSRHSLVTDRDGSVLLVTGGTVAPVFVIARFRNDTAGLQVETSNPMVGHLEAPLVVDDDGYWLIRRPPGLKKGLDPERLSSLPLKPVKLHSCFAKGL